MGENSKIEWTHHTFNPWIGCSRVSPGCVNCYAETMMDKRYHRVEWGPGRVRKRTAPANWRLPPKWNRHAEDRGIRMRVFCASLADVFDTEVPQFWRDDLWKVIKETPSLDWLLLTKRAAEMRQIVGQMGCPPNAWLGVSVEDQQRADERIHILRSMTEAKVRFLSAEPLLEEVRLNLDGIDWVIVGGETGAEAREMAAPWARSIQNQCLVTGVQFFMKQMTNRGEIPPDLLVRQFPG